MRMRRLLVLLLISVVGCTWLSPGASVLELSSCEPPCWNGITPGVTSKQETLDILSQLPIVEQDSLVVVGRPWQLFDDTLRFSLSPPGFLSRRPAVYGEAEILDGRVAELTLCGQLRITFGDVVGRTGPPNIIITVSGGEQGGLIVTALNPSLGLEYGYGTNYVPTDLRSELSPEIELSCLTYFDPALYDQMLDAGLFANGYAPLPRMLLQPWAGYGSLDELYPIRP